MKYIYITILASALSFGVCAQNAVTTTTTTSSTTTDTPVLKSKKGENYLPETGEWGLGVGASPFLGYLGNFFSGSTSQNASPSFDYASNPANRIAIFGKKMTDEHTAYRVRFNIGVSSNKDSVAVIPQNQINADPNFPAYTRDSRKVNTTSILIAPGIEKRRGSTRLQGVYGAELILGFNNSKTTYDYGNPISADFNTPNTTNFGNNISGTSRVTEFKSGINVLAGVRGFVGVEYFIVPKISIGGEFGYMLGYQTQLNAKQKTETWDGASVSTRTTESDVSNGGFKSIGLGLDNLAGSINLLFYF